MFLPYRTSRAEACAARQIIPRPVFSNGGGRVVFVGFRLVLRCRFGPPLPSFGPGAFSVHPRFSQPILNDPVPPRPLHAIVL